MKALRRMLALVKLMLPFSLSTPYYFLGKLLDKTLFEFKEAPVFGACLIMAIQADQQKRSQNGQCDRASHTLSLLGHLYLTQVQPSFQLLYRQLDVIVTSHKIRMVRSSRVTILQFAISGEIGTCIGNIVVGVGFEVSLMMLPVLAMRPMNPSINTNHFVMEIPSRMQSVRKPGQF